MNGAVKPGHKARAVVLADANFGPAAVQRTIDYLTVDLGYDVVAAVILGQGTDGFDLAVPTAFGTSAKDLIARAAADYEPETLLDLTEADIARKLDRAIIATRLGVSVTGADYVIEPPALLATDGPATVNVVGKGEVGKTAVSMYFLELAKSVCKPGYINMQLDAPGYPEVVSRPPGSPEEFVRAFSAGRIIEGDHYTVATLAGVPACGCSFAGTGLSGVPVSSVVPDGVLLLEEAGVQLAFVEGSGSSISPLKPDGWISVFDQETAADELRDFAFAYSVVSSDIAVITTPIGKAINNKRSNDLLNVISSMKPELAVEQGRIKPFIAGEVTGRTVSVVVRDGNASGPWVACVEKNRKAKPVNVFAAAVDDPAAAKFDADTVLIELGVSRLGRWLKKCVNGGVNVAFLAERFVPKDPKSIKAKASKLFEKALAARAARKP